MASIFPTPTVGPPELWRDMAILATDGLSKSFGGLAAVNEVSLSVRPGQVHALIGPNGAGKTTLLNLLAGTLVPSAGQIRLDGMEITNLAVHSRVRLGISRSYQVVNLFSGLSCRDVVKLAVQRDLGFRGLLSRRRDVELTRRADAALEAAGLLGCASIDSTRISHGLQKHLEIALALANESRLLLLDEPMAGMSASERTELRDRLRQLAGTRTIVFVEHDMDMVMTLADTITVMHNGRIVEEGTPEHVRSSAVAQSIYLRSEH